jgi:hypothetical protein
LTAFEKAMLEEFNAVALAELILPGLVQPIFHVNFVDARLGAPKVFRDVYHYDGDTLTGWTRYNGGKQARAEYTAEGWRVLEVDANGRPSKACTVEYRQAPSPRRRGANPNPLEPHDGAERITFRYIDGKRQIDQRTKVKE